VLNYLLIFGKLGLPAMGVQGAALATLIARVIELSVLLIYIYANSNKFPFFKKIFATFAIPREILKKLISKSANLLVNEGLWSGVQTALLYCYSLRGLEVVAAINISNTFNNLFSVVFLSLGNSIAIIVGGMLGAGKLDEARDADNKIMALSFVCCLFLGGVLALTAPLLVNFYTEVTPSAKQLAVTFMMIIACFMPFHSILHATYFTLRSGGKTMLTFIFDSGFATFVNLPLAFVLAKFTHVSAPLIFTFVNLIDFIKLAWGLILIKKGIWLNNLVSNDNLQHQGDIA
jgi:Na+-driven multidrug efflux pump